MELREMRAFVAVVEEGSLSAAARRLHVSQPALSQTMNALERQLGVQLFVRSSTGVQATESGMTLLAEARAVLARHAQAMAAVARHSAAGGSVLRLGVPLEPPTDLLSRPLGDLAATYPGTTVQALHMSTAAQFAALRAGEIDVGLVREHPIGHDLDAVLVVEERLGVLLATDQAAKITGPNGIRLDALAGLGWVGFPRAGSPAWYDELTAIQRQDKARRLLVRRSLSDTDDLAFYLCSGPDDTTIEILVHVAGTRWAIEECFKNAKGETGLAHYQVRRYPGWYRHITLSMLAYAYLAVTAATDPKAAATWSASARARSAVSWHT